ncbi:MAG: hypothetical protein GY947_22605 [Rhodobacteraceae bacterium]|nr:hypothetical protein [Paracoccaceae bacterium]
MSKSSKRTLRFLDQLNFLLMCVEDTYALYHANQKTFLFAKILRNQNEEIRQLLANNGAGVDDDMKLEIVKLLQHLNVWCEIWDYECSTQAPELHQEFSFENSLVFPKAAIGALMQHRKALMSSSTRN